MKRALTALLLLASAGLGYWLSQQTLTPEADDAPPPPVARALPPAPQAGQPAPEPTRAAELEIALGRPLFSSSRRPAAAAAAPVVEATAATLPRMSAILINGSTRSAIFDGGPQGKPAVLSEGDRLGAFTIRKIEPQQVTVAGPEGERVLHTSFDPHLAAAPPLPAVPAMAAPGQGLLFPPPAPAPFPLPPPGPYAPQANGLITPPTGTGVAR